jgi:transposase
MVCSDLDSQIPDDHPVRLVWEFARQADLSTLYAKIRAIEGGPGRTAIDPRLLLALWLFATLEGYGSARLLAQLCEDHIAYRWLCGGVAVNYHTLADFRAQTGAVFDELLTDSVTTMCASGLVTLRRVAHDGMRVRANAGKGSFRREQRLQQFQHDAQEQVNRLREELDEDPAAGARRRQAAQKRAAQDRLNRVTAAIKQYPQARLHKKYDKDQTRVSITDPDARRMHMADGGTRPAFNVQFTADTASQAIVAVSVVNSGSDGGLLLPAIDQIRQRYQKTPAEVLTDGGFVKKDDIETLATQVGGCRIFAPVPTSKTASRPDDRPYSTETPAVTEWRERMQTEAAKAIYKERAASIECVNAQARGCGLQQFPVRGLKKVLAVALLVALAHNLRCRARLEKVPRLE